MEFLILGPLEVRANGQPLALGGPKQRALLAILLLRAGRVVSRDRLIEELWADDPPSAAGHALEVHVSRLRKALAANGGESVLVTRVPGYLLRAEGDELDVSRFERLLAEGRRAREHADPVRAARILRDAEALWRGRPLSDLEFESFARGEIERLEELRLVAIEERIDAELALGRHRALVAELEALTAEQPLRERMRVLLMLALYRSGRQAEALEAYRRARSTLVEEIGAEPGPELRELQAAILRQDPALSAPGPAELPQELVAVSPLIGRETELAGLRKAWERTRGEGATIAAVSGSPGIGRTRLVAELAGQLHREGVTVVYVAGAVPEAPAARRPAMLVLDDVDATHAAALAELVRRLGSRPVLVVAITGDDGLIGRLGGAEHVALGRLSLEGIAAIAALYAPGEDAVPVAALAERSDGIPQRAHRLASEWARAAASRRLGPVADQAAAERGALRRIEQQLEGNVVELEAVRERRRLHDPERATIGCPFKGLAVFDVEDADVFFGRERLVAAMVSRLAGAPLLGVVGPSGSGKSSAVRAGLLAALAAGALPGSEGWTQVLLRPGEHPMRALHQATVGADARARVLITVDQFEETFTLCRDLAEQAAFLDALVELDDRRVAVVLAMRADLYGRCARHPELARLLGANHLLVGPMERDELRRAIELPAQRVALHLDPRLVEQLLADVAGEPGALPLLSSALFELWQRRDGRRIGLDEYERTGGVRRAIARLADAAYARLDPRERVVARRALLRLACDDDRAGPVRRRVPLAELDADRDDEVRRTLDVLAAGRLVTISQGTVEVAHEALLHEWPRLRGWLDEDAEGRRLRQHLALAAREWDTAGRDPAELYRGARLASTLEWAGEHAAELNSVERAFLDAGRTTSEREAGRVRRANRRLRTLLAAAAVLLVLAAGTGALFLDQRGEARREARTAVAQRLGAQALVEHELDRSLLLARQGVAVEDSLQTRNNLLAALLRSPAAVGVARITGNSPTDVALSPDGRALVVGDEHGTVTFVDPVTRRALHPPYRPQSSYVRQLVFSPDGSRLAVGGVGMIQLLNGRTFEPLSYLRLPPGDLQYFNVAFSPDGRVLIGMYLRPAGPPEEPRVKAVLLRFDGRSGRRLGRAASIASAGPLADAVGFDPGGRWIVTVARAVAVLPGESARTVVHGNGVVLRDPRTLRPLRSFPGVAVAGALSPDGATFALGGDDGTVRFLDLRTGTLRTASGRHQAAVRGLRFTSDGRSLVSVGDDARTIVWDVDAAAAAETLEGHAGPVVGLAIDPKGRTAYTTGFDGTLITWDLAGDRRLGRPFEAATTSGDRLVAMAISRDGRTLAVRQADGSLALTDLATLTRRRLRIHGVPLRRPTPYAPAFGPDGTLAISGADGLLALLDTRTGRVVSRLRGHRDIVFTPATSADGRTVASTGEDGTLRLWDAVAAQPLGSPISLGGSPAGGAAITPDGSEVAVPLDAGTVEVFDVRSQRRLASLRVDDSWPTVTRFSADGRLLLTGTEAGRVRVYTVRNPRPLGPAFATVAGTVSSVDASPDDRTLVTAGIDGRIRLWDVASRQPIGTPLPGAANVNAVAAFTPDGDHVVAVFATGRGYRWDVRPSAWERQACAIAGRRLTRAEWHAALPGREYAPAC